MAQNVYNIGLQFIATNDALSVNQAVPLTLKRDGTIAPIILAGAYPQLKVRAADAALIQFENTGAAADAKKWRLWAHTNGTLVIDCLNDAESAVTSAPLTLSRSGDVTAGRYLSCINNLYLNEAGKSVVIGNVSGYLRFNTTDYGQVSYMDMAGTWTMIGDVIPLNLRARGSIYELGRAAALGQWTDVAYSAANFGSFTVGTQDLNCYTLIGKTMIWIFSWRNCNVTAAVADLTATIPAGVVSSTYQSGSLGHTYNVGFGYPKGTWLAQPGAPYLVFRRADFANPWAVGLAEFMGVVILRIP
jgi:hypothetical protein